MKKNTNKNTVVYHPGSNDAGILFKRNDVRIARIRQLQHRDFRDQHRLFFCEGTRFLIKAYERGVHIESCIYAPQLFTTPYAEKLLDKLRRRGIPTLRVSREVFLSLSLADEPSGLLAVCSQKIRRLHKVTAIGAHAWLALEKVRSPGNLGTIMRTCDAVNITGIILLDQETDPYHPAAVRASMGSIMSAVIVRSDMNELLHWADREHCQIVGTSPDSALDYKGIDYKLPTVLLMGSERKGIQPDLLQKCSRVVSIPMPGKTDSLNLAVATGVMLYELLNQRSDAGGACSK